MYICRIEKHGITSGCVYSDGFDLELSGTKHPQRECQGAVTVNIGDVRRMVTMQEALLSFRPQSNTWFDVFPI